MVTDLPLLFGPQVHQDDATKVESQRKSHFPGYGLDTDFR